jgi:uncharacterized protein YbjT (DUF2867 family)
MRIAILGASGRTGRHLVDQALAAGFEVSALVRDSSKLPREHERLRIERGDAMDSAAVEAAVRGTDAVISVIVPSASPERVAASPLTVVARTIIAAMNTCGVRRLIISSAGIPQPNDARDPRFGLMMGIGKLIMNASYVDHIASARLVRDSGLDWTIVRMAGPSNAPGTGFIGAGYVSRAVKMRIARADAAAFMLDEVREPRLLRESPVIWSRRSPRGKRA